MTDGKFPTAITAHKATFGKLQDELSSEQQEGDGLLKTDGQKPEEISVFCISLYELLERMEKTMSVFITCVNDWEVKTKEQRDAKTALETDIAKGKENIEDGFTLWRKLKKKERTMGGCNKEPKTGNAAQTKPTVKLPNLELPIFEGDILAYQEFSDLFSATIDDNETLSPVQKFCYLRKYLTGKPLELIGGLKVCDHNYKVALDILQDRYGNKKTMMDAHYTAIVGIPACTSHTDSLRSCINSIEIHLRSLEAQGENVSQNVFITLILSKLPREVKLQLELSRDDKDWTMPTLRKALSKLLHAKEQADSPKASHEAGSKFNKTKLMMNSGYSDHTLVSHATAPRIIKCLFCGDKHYNDECTKYNTLAQRKSQLGSRCFICLKTDHNAKACKNTRSCFHCNKKSHHRSLCPNKFGSEKRSNESTLNADAEPFRPESHAMVSNTSSSKVLMQTAVTTLSNGNKSIPVRIMFDTGSSKSYINRTISEQLGLDHDGEEEISVATFGASKRVVKKYPIVNAKVTLQSGKQQHVSLNVTDHITCPILKVPLKRYQSLSHLPLAEPLCDSPQAMKIDVLLGADQYYQFVGTERIEYPNGLILVDSTLGFLVAGKVGMNDDTTLLCADACTLMASDAPPNQLLERFWDLQSIGIPEHETDKSDDIVAHEQFTKNVESIDGRYHVSWPWKCDPSENLPENYELAHGRLKSLMKRLGQTPEVLHKYHETIIGQLDKGIIEEIPSRSENSDGPCHYIPHHCVIKPDSTTTKIRVVYDASAKSKKDNLSLNECMYRGPVLLPDLCGILIRFRLAPIAITSDIEKAFLQVGLHTSDRNVTRFLWLRDISKPPTPDNIVIYRFCRIPFGTIASPYLLSATIGHHLQNSGTQSAATIENNTYVDNVLGGALSVDEAIEYYRSTKELFSGAAMNLREWATNSDEVNNSIPEHDRCDSDTVKVLGMLWDTKSDELCLNSCNAEFHEVRTKREMLSAISTFYDPLGYFSPIIFRGKLLLQDVWKMKCDWDEALPESIWDQWREIAHDLSEASRMKFPRYATPTADATSTYELHVFCDASKSGYGAVAYLRTISEHPSVQVILTKSRVAPVKETTIPRLELLAAVVGARIVNFLRKELQLPLAKTYLWSDSQCVLGWINGNVQSLPTFVANRVSEIRKNESVMYRYVNTKCNPADILSRGTTSETLMKSDLWWKGPQWDMQENAWETTNHVTMMAPTKPLGEGLTESAQENISLPDDTEVLVNVDKVVDHTRFSSFSKMVRVTAWVQRFVDCSRKLSTSKTQYLTVEETENAELLWFKYAQQCDYQQEITAMKNNTSGKYEVIPKLGLFLDEHGLVRCQGRMTNSDLPESTRYPILLSGKNTITRMIIEQCHKKILHAGVSHTLIEIRKRFWVTRGRKSVMQAIKPCKVCKRYEGGPFKMPNFAPLPKERVTQSAPFTSTGIDYFGPVSATEPTGKVWVILFTCLATRAIHLELVTDMTTDSFLLALKRFTARRGVPTMIVSDNAKQFKLANTTLEKLWNSIQGDKNLMATVSDMGIKWRFIVQLSPWMGGVYERLVQSVKRALRKSLGRRVIGTDELTTLLTEIESVINSRPLTYVGDELDSMVLTPAHFLCLNPRRTGLPSDHSIEDDIEDPNFSLSSNEALLQKFTVGQQRLQAFWNLWHDEYLATLRERTDHKLSEARTRSDAQPAVGTIVIVKEDGLPRCTWPLGKIISINTSDDGESRSATVLLPTGNDVNRSLCHLYPIEVPTETSTDKPQTEETVQQLEVQSQCSEERRARPTRRAALEGRSKMLAQQLSEQ